MRHNQVWAVLRAKRVDGCEELQMSFSTLGLIPELTEVLGRRGFDAPTPIQERVIPIILEKRDVVGLAQTGSGKTASFVLPILQLWDASRGEGKPRLKVLVLTPTRELALQVADVFRAFDDAFARRIVVVSAIGGESIGDQLYAIQQGCDVLVATPGRFLDILRKKQMNLSRLECLVLDEADKMLDLGFAEELDAILDAIPEERQNLLFSATYPEKAQRLASKITLEPTEVHIEPASPIVDTIQQRVIQVNHDKRGPLLRHLLHEHEWPLVLVFMASKRASNNIAEKFRRHGFAAASFNGDLDQDERIETLDAFKGMEINVLFATDIAARGLDIDDVSCVVNYDLPRSPADYVHRIGRTARAGKSGVAISFIDYDTLDHFRLI
ncbi:MAG: DEAD/DEAH box helicase [Myxococcota bacterium]|nr:DEAD/DEAH box helicase [Myxococcota bacterium]